MALLIAVILLGLVFEHDDLGLAVLIPCPDTGGHKGRAHLEPSAVLIPSTSLNTTFPFGDLQFSTRMMSPSFTGTVSLALMIAAMQSTSYPVSPDLWQPAKGFCQARAAQQTVL